MRLSSGEQRQMEARLAVRYAAAGEKTREWLEKQLSALSPDCALLTRWCYSASPLSDWASYDFSLFQACAEHGLFLRENSPFARTLPETLFLNYVLHPRVNEEELCDCRGTFYAQLRERVKGLSAREAALAVNYWNAEQVCYRATDDRTISALGAWRSGFGRCGEESTFAVNALRAVGLPARQVYTPRWAHCDDNHAWVEVFCDGAWHFLGACEPEEALDCGWFTGAASRALLVHSRCFGTPAADEEVIAADGAVTFLNQTARYAPVRTLTVQVSEPDGRPSTGAEVTFGILNESQVFPAAVIRTDVTGAARLRCGCGGLIVQARQNGLRCERLCTSEETRLELTLAEPKEPSGRWCEFKIHAPKERASLHGTPTPAQKARAAEKLAAANEKRRLRTQAAFDAARTRRIAGQSGCGAEAERLLRASCGNFEELADFLEDPAYSAQAKIALLRTLNEKDLRDVRSEVLRETLECCADISPEDAFAMRYIVCPRIGTEPLSCWRRALLGSFSESQKQAFREESERIWQWIQVNIRQAPEAEYRQLVTLPVGAMRLRCADMRSQRLLFVAVCRTLGIAARLNPETGAAEYFSSGCFQSPEKGRKAAALLCLEKQPGETWQHGTDLGAAVLEDGAWRSVSLRETKWDGARLTAALYPGIYRILTDNRLPNGDLYAACMELRLETGERKSVQLRKQPVSFSELAVDFMLADFQAEALDGRLAASAALTERPSFLMWLEEGCEPTEHLLNELLERQRRIRDEGVELSLLLRGRKALNNEKLRSVLAAFPEAKIWITPDSAEPAARSAYVEPGRLPLLLVCDQPRHIIHASAGYRIGSVDTALDFLRCLTEKT